MINLVGISTSLQTVLDESVYSLPQSLRIYHGHNTMYIEITMDLYGMGGRVLNLSGPGLWKIGELL
jgi:hypothetical protein